MSDHECKIAEKLQLVHKWAHRVTDVLSLSELAEAHGLGNELLAFLDNSEKNNGIKLLAIIEVACVGADHMESGEEPEEDDEDKEKETLQ